MRFSSLFQQPVAQHEARAAGLPRARPEPQAPSVPLEDLPDDLDARVRLVGEWQQLEG
jgi:hypothetical protein